MRDRLTLIRLRFLARVKMDTQSGILQATWPEDRATLGSDPSAEPGALWQTPG